MKETHGYNVINFEDKGKILRNTVIDSEAFKKHLKRFETPRKGRKYLEPEKHDEPKIVQKKLKNVKRDFDIITNEYSQANEERQEADKTKTLKASFKRMGETFDPVKCTYIDKAKEEAYLK